MEKKKILIVDEEKWFVEAIFDRINSDFGENLFDHCVNGSEAIELILKNEYKVIILDLMLPLGHGINLPEDEQDLMFGIYILRKIRDINKTVPVICYTILDERKIQNQIADLNAIHICKLSENSFDQLFQFLRTFIN